MSGAAKTLRAGAFWLLALAAIVGVRALIGQQAMGGFLLLAAILTGIWKFRQQDYATAGMLLVMSGIVAVTLATEARP